MKIIRSFLLFLLIWLGFGSEKIETQVRKLFNEEFRAKPAEDIKEFEESLKKAEEEYIKITNGFKVKKDCKIERGIASWYGGIFHGRRTANGEIYNLYKYTAASRTLPLDTYVLVINEENGRFITVRINDRGPYVAGRIIDLSLASAYKLGMAWKGLAFVSVVPLRCLSPDTIHRIYDEIIADLINTY